MRRQLWLVLFCAVYFVASAQQYKFQRYGVENGICHPFTYAVNQDKNGFIWVSTGTGLCRFDGFGFASNGNYKDSLPETFAAVIFKDNAKNLWFGYSDGTVVVYDGRKFKLIEPEGAQSGGINDFIGTPGGKVIAICQSSGIMLFDQKLKKTIIKEPFQDKLLYSAGLDDKKQLIVGTGEGIEIYSFDENSGDCKFVSKLSSFPLTKVNKITSSVTKKGYWVATEDAGLCLLTRDKIGDYVSSQYAPKLTFEQFNIQSVNEDRDGKVWVATKEAGIYKLTPGVGADIASYVQYNTTNGLSLDFVKQSYQDNEGNMWFATYGNGLAMLLNESFISYSYKKEFPDNNILSVCFGYNCYWLGGKKGIIQVKTGVEKSTEFLGASAGIPSDDINALYYDTKGTLWIGTDKNGIYQLPYGAKRAVSFLRYDNSLSNSINDIAGKGSDIYIGTKNGIYIYSLVTKQQKHLSTTEGLPYNNIRQIYFDNTGNPWIATRSKAPFSLNNDQRNIKGKVELDFTAIVQDKEGDIWAGTNGNGIFEFTKDTFYMFSSKDGLKSDFCYSLTTDQTGNIWVGHRMGMSRIHSKTHQIKVYGTECMTGDVNFNAVRQNADGNILFGTTDGAVYYESSKDKKKVSPPIANITSVIINDKVYDTSEPIVLPYSNYRMKIEFIGLNYANPDQVTYQYKMEGYDLDWSEPSKTHQAIIPRISDGEYTFMVKACNSDGSCTETPVTLLIKIRKPFWKTWWFILLSIIALVGAVYAIIVYRERKQKAFQIYLEKLLDERTREVREQKEEIELKNRDITDSINYAQRIQASILPSMKKLQNYFTGSFVYYAPRDIVSGDFYWFEFIPNTSKFLIVCADSTGHGVPGAFMSIIGTTLLKDVFNRPDISKPSDILRSLDDELKLTLNQNVDGERPNDGMDIIVCEIDVKTYNVRFSSAMRPFIVYQNGEQLCYKGSRSSIGGRATEEKEFEDVELQLSKGDLIYMFSDGYPDQFGGPLAKKFKMVRLRNLLADIYQKPMEEQYNYVKSNFELWKGELPQVDDVLFMGIKI